nr:hypothetical protein [Tanacetum cinerariifolium]
VKENQEKDKNRIKTGQRQEACRSREKFKAVAVGRARKTEQNAKRMVKEKQENDKIRSKPNKKREACRSWEKFKAVTVNRGRKTEQNAKRMAENANAVKTYSSFKKKEEEKGSKMQLLENTTTGAKADNWPKLYGQGLAMQKDV